MNLAQLLIDRAGRQPTAVAVVDDEGPVEYGELVAMAAGWARWFLDQRLEFKLREQASRVSTASGAASLEGGQIPPARSSG
jgi:hypothetical protein